MASGTSSIEFLLNGHPVRAERPTTDTTLLDDLRARGLTGAKEGCAEGECGACTVLLVAPADTASEYRAVNSCLMPLPMAAGHEIYTVESLARDGRLCEAQAAMAAAGGSQCGYCTPGFVMSLFAEQYRPSRSGRCSTAALGGNLCRCTGYRPIRDAAESLGPAPDDGFRERLMRAAPRLGAVNIGGFSRPTSIEDCVALLTKDRAAVIVAGATDLGVESNLKARRWPHLVSVEAIGELHEIRCAPASIHLGAAVPLTDITRRWRNHPAVLDEWSALFSSPPIRNRATLGGNLATASPIGDAAPLLLSLGAIVHLAGADGRRTVPLKSFFSGYRKTVMQRTELIVGIEIPLPLPAVVRFYKVAKRRVDDISTVAAAMALDYDEDGLIRRANFAFGGVAATPVLLEDAARAVVGERWDEAAVARVQAIVERSLTPMSDHRGSQLYRSQVSSSLVEKFWWERSA